MEVEGNGSVRERRSRFASLRAGDFASSRLGMGEGIGMGPHTRVLWCRWLGAASGDAPHVYPQTETYKYIYIYTPCY